MAVDSTIKRKTASGSGYDIIHPKTNMAQVEGLSTALANITIDSLNDIADVNVPSPTDGYVLTWDSATSKWTASAAGVDKADLQNVYIYGKASVAITKGQAIQFAGAQGDHILIKPAVPSEINANPNYIIGIAETNLTINNFGYVIINGRLNINTSVWAAGDILYFASAGTTNGALTTTEPTDPNASIEMAAVSIDGVGNGELVVRTTIFTRQINEIIGLQGALDDKLDLTGGTLSGPLKGQDLMVISRKFEMLSNISTQYILLCRNAANNDINGHIRIDRTSAHYQIASLDVIVTSTTSAIIGGSIFTHQFTQSDENYDLVTLTYGGNSWVAIRYIGHPYPYSTSNFTGILRSTDEETSFTTVAPGSVTEVALLSTADTKFKLNDNNIFHDGYHPNADKWTTARTLTIGSTGKSVDGSGNVSWSLADIGAIPTSEKGANSGVATLDSSGKLTNSQIPDYLIGGLKFVGGLNLSGNTKTLEDLAIELGTMDDVDNAFAGSYWIVSAAGGINAVSGHEWQEDGAATPTVLVWDDGVQATNNTTDVNLEVGDWVIVTSYTYGGTVSFGVINNNDPRFSNYLPLTGGTLSGNITAPNVLVGDYIYHNGDTNTYLYFASDDMQLVAGGRQMLRMDEGTDPDRLRFVTDSNWTDSSGNWSMSGDVGIGTTSPRQKLDVNGNAHFGNHLIGTGIRASGRGEFYLNSTGIDAVSEMFFGYGAGYTEANIRWGISDRGVTDGTLNFYKGPANGGFSTIMTLTKNDKVGIGTESPGYKLDINNSTDYTHLRLGGSGVPLLKFAQDSYNSGNGAELWQNAGKFYINIRSNLNAMVIDTSGNVGIGTASPVAKLAVEGAAYFANDIYLRDGATASGDVLVRIYDSSDDGIIDVYRNNSVVNRIHGNGASFFTAGNVGIGTSSPASTLQVQGSSTQNVGTLSVINTFSAGGVMYPALRVVNTHSDHSYGTVAEFRTQSAAGADRPSILFTSNHGGHTWSVGQGGYSANDNFAITYRSANPADTSGWGTSRLMIDTSGNVGIGTTAPSRKLSVSGDISTTGDIYMDGVLYHGADTNTYLYFASDRLQLVAGGRQILNMTESTDPDILTLVDSSTSSKVSVGAPSATTGKLNVQGEIYSDANKVWHEGNLKPNNFFNFNTTRATTTTFTSRGQQTLSTGSYLITIIGSYNVTYGGTSYAPQFGIFFSDPLNVAIMGNVVIRNNISDGNAHIQTISAPSTLASAVSGSFVSGPFIPTNSSLNYPIYISARVTLTANRTIYFGSRVTSAGGGGGPQMNTNSTMIIEPL